jgi:hypothetical protein
MGRDVDPSLQMTKEQTKAITEVIVPGRDLERVDAAADLEGLTDEQRDELSDLIHEEKRRGDRRDISFGQMRRWAQQIKLESEGRGGEVEPSSEDAERTQTRGDKHAREERIAEEKEEEGKAELEDNKREVCNDDSDN